MKILKRLFSVAFAIAFIVFLSGFASKEKNAAAVINENSVCGIPDFDTGMVYYATVHSVTSHGGTSTLMCKSKDALGTGKSREWSGFLCGTYLGLTMDSNLVISAEGNASMRCRVKKTKM